MVVEALMTLCSIHPGHDGEYNAFNPGLLLSAGPRTERAHPYVIGGVYRDSYNDWSSVVGAGCRFGDDRFGIDILLCHVDGSGLEDIPVVPIPSIYVGYDDWKFRAIWTNAAIAFGVSYTVLK